MRSGARRGRIDRMYLITDPELSVVVSEGPRVHPGVAELWCGSALLGIVHEEDGALVLRLESHARGTLTVNVVALERALADTRARLAHGAPVRVPTRESTRDSS
jgi:hypothetical protein